MIARNLFDQPNLFRRNPFGEMDRLRREMDLLTNAVFGQPGFRVLGSGVFPAVNLTEDADSYYARAELPGIAAEDLNIQLTGRNLAISGERKISAEGEDVRYHRREREAGRFSKIIALPGETDGDKIQAKMSNGVLTITLPKTQAAKPKQITVQ